jgi:hypothetical protein
VLLLFQGRKKGALCLDARRLEGLPARLPDFAKYGYVWARLSDYEIYTATPDGKNIANLTNSPGYDAEATDLLERQSLSSSLRNATATSSFIRWM